MKNVGAKLKSMNYKQLAVDHIEKIVFGLFAAIALLSLVGTRWSTFDKEPLELQMKTDDAKSKILASIWPEEKKQEFLVNSDVREQVRMLVSPIEPSKWDYGNEGPSWPLQKKRVPIREPEWMVVEELEAKAGHFILSLRTEDELDMEFGPGYIEEGTDPEMEIDEFTPRTAVGVPGGVGGVGAGDLANPVGAPLAGRGAAAVDPRGRGRNRPGNADGGTGGVDPLLMGTGGAMPGAAGAMMGAGGMGTIGTGKGRGVRFISVRGVFNIWKQIDKIARSSGQTLSPVMYGNLLEFIDFTLERQTAVAGEDKWSGPWEKVNIQVAKDLLDESSNFDPDVVDPGITDPVFTMPLPERGLGYWTEDIASHPLVRNYQLSPEEMEREMRINEKLIEQYQKMEDQGGKRFSAKPGGFADQMLDIRGIRQDVFTYGRGDEFITDLVKDMDPENREKALMNSIKDRVSAQGRVLLFRYLDFDVEPENAYRYRVKLTVRNPNYERSLTEVLEPSVIEGETRDTPWSESSNPAYVPKDTHYFMSNIQLSRGKDVTGAKFDVYQWYADSGTTINKELNVQLGQVIGGEEEAKVLRPLEQSFEDEKKVIFDTGDTLVDARDATKLDPKEHPELVMPAKRRGRLGNVSQAVVMNRYGELVSMDPMSTSKQHNDMKKRLEREQGPFEALKDAIKYAEEEASSLNDLLTPGAAAAAGTGGMMPGDPSSMRRGGRNPLRRSRGGRGAEMMMPGAMPGMAAPTGAAGAAAPAAGVGPGAGRGRRGR